MTDTTDKKSANVPIPNFWPKESNVKFTIITIITIPNYHNEVGGITCDPRVMEISYIQKKVIK